MIEESQRLEFRSPPGYGTLVPLNRAKHAGLGLPAMAGFQWCAALNSVYLSAPEMARAALDYPIGFIRENPSGDFLPVAVLGLRGGENLFVDSSGRWREHSYVPAYVRRYPFCIVELPSAEAAAEPQRLICVQEDRLVPSPTPFFDAQGEPTPAWTPALQLIEAIEGARLQTRTFARRLDAFGLMTPFDALAMPSGGVPMRLQGLYRVDEEKLKGLAERELRQLLRKNELRAVYAHLLSLENFARLMTMTVESDGRRNQAH
jgi:hypothetical protein